MQLNLMHFFVVLLDEKVSGLGTCYELIRDIKSAC